MRSTIIMTRGENGEGVSMPHDVQRRAPIQCFWFSGW
jgi:hypothetical protein